MKKPVTASTEKRLRNLKPFVKGQSGNPKGREKGSRNKLGEEFISSLQADFLEHGTLAIQTMRANDPGGYVRVIASILPKEVKVTTAQELTDEQLDQRIRQLATALDLEVRAGEPVGGAASPQTTH